MSALLHVVLMLRGKELWILGLRDRTADSDILLAPMILAWDSDGSLRRWVKKARGQAFEKGRIKAGLTTETKAASDCSINRRKLSLSTTP